MSLMDGSPGLSGTEREWEAWYDTLCPHCRPYCAGVYAWTSASNPDLVEGQRTVELRMSHGVDHYDVGDYLKSIVDAAIEQGYEETKPS